MADEFAMNLGGGETQSLSLADLAGLSTGEIKEIRGDAFPSGIFHFRATDAKLEKLGTGDAAYGAIIFDFECVGVKEITDNKDDAIDAEALIGKKHREMVNITDDFMDSVGKTLAFMTDTGHKYSGELLEAIKGFVGHEFIGKLTQRASKDDPDRKFANFNIRFGQWKVGPVVEETAQA